MIIKTYLSQNSKVKSQKSSIEVNKMLGDIALVRRILLKKQMLL